MDFKDTLLMPKTDFEMRGNLPEKEPDILREWEADDHYNKILAAHAGEPTFVLHDGPPYANGNLHAGTAMNRIIKDIIVRSKAMNGHYTPYFPGWDTHGLPIENAIQKLGINPKEVGIKEFREKADEYARNQIKTQMATMKRLGQVADFEHPYISLQKEFEARQIKSFAKMAMDGLIYQGLKPIYWSPYQETAIADSEIVYIDRKDPTIFVKFDVKDGKGILSGDDSFVIWTTTPWTIPANLAICLNEGYTYALVKTEKGNLIVLESKVDELMAKFELNNLGIIKTFKGRELEGITCTHVLDASRESVIILGNHVTDEDGTGCVHTAPGHGADDFNVGLKYGLKAFCPVDEKGLLTIEAGQELAGKFVLDANKDVCQILDRSGHLLKLEFITHSYPHDERLKKPVIFRATVQWFASISKIREQLLKEIHNVNWLNEWGEVRLTNMIKDRTDWCISRQRLWGVPIPIIYNEDKSPIMDQEVFDHIASLIAEHGSGIWFEKEAKELLPLGYTNEKSPNGNFTKEKDIMDVWFDSGSSHNELLARGLKHPCDLYFEGSDQYRGWFNSSLIVSLATYGHAPYKSVLSHGYVVDSEGKKMSKSVGNVVNPIDIIEKYGADILRLWAGTVNFKDDMRIGESNLKQVSEQYRKIRNTFRFMLGNINPEDFNPKKDMLEIDTLNDIDSYILVKLNELIVDVKKAYDNYNFLDASLMMTNFMTNTVSAYYLDFTKDILYIEAKNSLRRRGVQTVIYKLCDSLVKLWAPILSYTTYEVWKYFSNDEAKSVHYTHFPMPIEINRAEDLKQKFERLFLIRADIFKALEEARNEKLIGKPLEASVCLNVSKADKKMMMETLGENIAQWLIVSEFKFVEEELKQYETSQVRISPMNGEKCPRCWTMYKHLNKDGICQRCEKALADK